MLISTSQPILPPLVVISTYRCLSLVNINALALLYGTAAFVARRTLWMAYAVPAIEENLPCRSDPNGGVFFMGQPKLF